MDVSYILQKEECNAGDTIHLFYNPEISVWIAHGKSAFALRIYLKSLGYDNLRIYSPSLQMPVTIIGEDSVKRLKALHSFNVNSSTEYVNFNSKNDFNEIDFQKWVEKLKKESVDPIQNNIKTPVSQYVPKDAYISDNMSSFSRNVKRIGDGIAAGVCLIIFSPLFLFCYLSIKIEDGGPAIFKQERIGRFGKPFFIYKFRSMSVNAEKNGPQLSHGGGNSDQRLTKVGKFLRAHHLDELPQLWNVFNGQMSFIGPRPERQYFIEQIMEYDKRYAYLYQIRPGVTSYATLYNGYTDTIEKMLRRLEYDLYYLGHRSWWFDFKILIKTFLSIIFGKKF